VETLPRYTGKGHCTANDSGFSFLCDIFRSYSERNPRIDRNIFEVWKVGNKLPVFNMADFKAPSGASVTR
jgi:hypothetical protein